MASCNIDNAAELSDFYQELALQNRVVMTGDSLDECEDCGDDIPDERKNVGGVTRCIDCQGIHEKKTR